MMTQRNTIMGKHLSEGKSSAHWLKALSHGLAALRGLCTTAATQLLLVTSFIFAMLISNLAYAAPTVALTAPTAATQFGANATISFTATATADAGQTITKVDFYRNTTLIGTDTTAPYNATWSTPTAGAYSFTAKATTSTNLTVTTATTSITVTAAPTVALSAPTSNTGFAAGSNITVSATATPSTGQTLTKVEFFAGTTLIGTDTTSPYSIVWTAAPASPTGSYSITAKATDNLAGTKTSTARNINVTTPPTVTLTAPVANTNYGTPATITLSADVSVNAVQTITQVQFYRGTTLLGTDTTAPYSFAWTNTAPGAVSLTAKATTNLNLSTSSTAVSVTFKSPPTVALSAPANNATFTALPTITVSATATPSTGQTLTKVEFFAGTTLIGTDTTSPYSISWPTVAGGSYSLTAKATDNLGGATTSAARTITVAAAPVNVAPTVNITAPANNATYITPASVTITANAADTDGTITQVAFYNGATLINTDTTAPYSYNLTGLAVGNYTLTAVATDNSTATTTSAAVNISVTAPPNVAPVVSITAPANNATYTAPANIALTATAADSDGTISQVQFYNNATLLGTATQQGSTSTYLYNWNNVAQGSYTNITVKAIDNSGNVASNTTSSAPIQLTVTAGVAQVYYIHTDQLNTPRLITNSANAKVWEWNNDDPFANNPVNDDPNATGNHFTYNPRLPGQYFDSESNTNYNYFRDYDPATGRYIESDPIGLEGGINTYGYVGGDPMSQVDTLGLAPNDVRSDNAMRAAGLQPLPPDDRSPAEKEKDQCELVCSISVLPCRVVAIFFGPAVSASCTVTKKVCVKAMLDGI